MPEITDPALLAQLTASGSTGGARAAPGGGKLKQNYAMGANGIAAPIPGTPEAQKASDAAAARASELRQMQFIAEGADKMIPRAVGAIEAFSSWVQPTTGIVGRVMAKFPGSAAYNFERSLDPVKANIGFDRLAQMRAQSPTGAALGSVSDSENKMLQATMASLDPGQDVDQLKSGLARVRDEYRARLKDRGGLLSAPRVAPARPTASNGTVVEGVPDGTTKAQLAAKYRKHTGAYLDEEMARRRGMIGGASKNPAAATSASDGWAVKEKR